MLVLFNEGSYANLWLIPTSCWKICEYIWTIHRLLQKFQRSLVFRNMKIMHLYNVILETNILVFYLCCQIYFLLKKEQFSFDHFITSKPLYLKWVQFSAVRGRPEPISNQWINSRTLLAFKEIPRDLFCFLSLLHTPSTQIYYRVKINQWDQLLFKSHRSLFN